MVVFCGREGITAVVYTHVASLLLNCITLRQHTTDSYFAVLFCASCDLVFLYLTTRIRIMPTATAIKSTLNNTPTIAPPTADI